MTVEVKETDEGHKRLKKEDAIKIFQSKEISTAEQDLFNNEEYWDRSAEEVVEKLDKK